MPITWDQATYDAAYSSKCRVPGHTVATVGHDQGDFFAYGREMMDHGRFVKYEMFRDLLITNFGITSSDRVLIAGSGYGYTIEAFHDAGFPWVGGIESSAHIIGNKATEIRGDVLFIEDDLRNGGQIGNAMRKLQQDLGVPGNQRSNQWDFAVTESMVEGYSDAELPGLLDDSEWAIETNTPIARLIHMVHTDPTDPALGLNDKTLAEWAAMRPTHSWQEVTGAKGFVIGSGGL